jgi:hypothetical protein
VKYGARIERHDPENLPINDVNTIANYGPEIFPFLNAPIGSAF